MTLFRRLFAVPIQDWTPPSADTYIADDMDQRASDIARRLDFLDAQAEVLDGGKRAKVSGRGPRR